MDQTVKKEILEKAKLWMKDILIPAHIKNTKKLSVLDEIKINPFLWYYIANFYLGNSNPKSLATALVLPRALGTSITTSFGQNMQKFISDVLKTTVGSTTPGIDIEYMDALDGRKKYCQLKSGPQALNRPDVKTVKDHFQNAINLARQNNLNLQHNDLVFAMLYGEPKEYNSFVKELAKDYIVHIGKNFWYRLTGDENFYFDLSKAMAEVAETVDSKKLVKDTIEKLTKDIEKAL